MSMQGRLPEISEFAIAVDHLCAIYDGSVTSWRRSRSHNERVGGVTNSWHLVGRAVDIVLDDAAKAPELMAAARRFGLKALDEKTHVHLEPDLDG